jgi:pyruvate,water dikinase
MDRIGAMLGYADLVVDTGLSWYATVNGYAYLRGNFQINWRGLPRWLPALLGGKPVRVTFGRGIQYWRDEVLLAHLRTIERCKGVDPAAAPDEQLLDGIRELARSEAVYWGSTTLALAAAKNSDLALNRFLSVAFPRSGLSSARFLRGFPSRALDAEAELQSIAQQVRASDELRELVPATPARRLLDALSASSSGRVALARLQQYLDRYGHQVYNLDFAEPTQGANWDRGSGRAVSAQPGPRLLLRARRPAQWAAEGLGPRAVPAARADRPVAQRARRVLGIQCHGDAARRASVTNASSRTD